ncbi:MAG TPA: hypothetical protein VHE34_17690 [Puia sp.]|nr:hypothetical protein [Puia sp.]HVU97069.1 hypothetical protein [Puia sp.]
MDTRKIKARVAEIVVIVLAWLMALSLLYLFLVKLALLKNIFH